MKLQALNLQKSVRKATIGLVGGVAVAALAACSGPSTTTSEAPTSESPVAEAPATTDSPVATSPAAGGTQSSASGTVVDVASSDSSFSTLTEALKAAGLTETLSEAGPYTVFAPTNEAFDALPPETLQALLRPENKDALTRVLTYHVVPQSVTSAQITTGEVPTVEGKPISAQVDSTSGTVSVNDATVAKADITASNGVIHAIDKVLLPPDFDPSQLK